MNPRVAPSFVLAALLLASPAAASNGSIDLFFDPNGNTCSGDIASGTSATIYVMARLTGATINGITGAEFKINGLPAGWTFSAVPNSSAIVTIGEPFSGATLTFANCQPGNNQFVLLWTVTLNATTAVTDRYLSVVGTSTPFLAPGFECPALADCSGPQPTVFCALGGQLILNPQSVHCTVPVERTTWSTVKSLYGRP